DSVVLEITPSDTTATHPAGVPFLLRLNKGEGYVLGNDSNTLDLSGTKIRVIHTTCCNPINVFMNHREQVINWPIYVYGTTTRIGQADQLIEQLLPQSSWDTVYPVVRFRNNPFSLLKLVSASNNNRVFLMGCNSLVSM